jgi:hypothetical protein
MIYVIVNVSYDYHRFQDNIGAATSLESARKIAQDYASQEGNIPIVEDAKASLNMGGFETRHIWIQKFK